jgi:uncharacterized membrane protein
MGLPAYIPTRTVGFRGVLELEQGKGLTARVAVRSSGSLRWADTGELFETLGGVFSSGRGASVTFPLPVTDDDGWLTTANEIIDVSEGGAYTHTYTATVVVMDASGRQVGDVYEYGPFVVPASDSTLWLDELEEQTTTAGSVVARPTVYAVNGQDGDVTITAAGLGAYVKPGTGVPKTDLEEAVQTSLGKADTALQPADVGTMAAENAADYLTADQTNAAIETVVEGMELGGQNIRLDALAAGQRLRATLAGSESEPAQGVTVSAMSARDTTSAVSIGAATFTQTGSIITTSVAHNLVVGDPVSFGTITTTTGLSVGDVYFVREVLSSTTFTVTTAVGGALRMFTNDGSTVAVYRRERAWNRQASALNAGIRVTETRPVQANASFPRWEYIRPDPSIVTYAPGSYTGTAMRVETEYGGTVLGVLARYGSASTRYNVYVDGRLAKTILAADFTGAGVTSGNLGRITLTFPTARRRAIVVEMESGSDEFPGFETQGGQPLIFPTSTNKGPRVLIVGDSFTEGTGAGTSRPYTRWLQKLMGWIDVWKGGSGSTGYTNDGQRLALIDRYSNDIIAQQAQIVIIAMGINDSSQTLSTVLADAETIWDATLASSYTRELVIVGPWPNNGGAGTVSAPLVALDDGLAALAVEKGIRYISPISEGWQFTIADATHPDPAGHEYIAWRLAGHLSVPYIAA